MRERRFLVREIDTESEVEIRGPEAHHLLHVLRLGPGDEVVVFDGKGHQYRAVLTRCGPSSATARKLAEICQQDSSLEISMAVAIPKGDSMSIIVRKLTELGVNHVTPLVSGRTLARSPATLRKRLSRWRRIAGAASKQSGRSLIPAIATPLTFGELVDLELPAVRILTCRGGGALPSVPRPRSCLVLIGPEGGWTADEIRTAVGKGFSSLGLGPRTLRTETAAVAAAAVVQWAWGDARRDDNKKDDALAYGILRD